MNKENKKKHYLIYQTTNLINNKIYIGKHITENIEDQYFGSGKNLKRAIEKYGLENFEFKILMDLNNEEEMNLLEKCVVTQDFCDRKDTYNINVGGDGGWSYINNIGKNIGFSYANKNGLNNKGKTISASLRKRLVEGQRKDRKIHPERYDKHNENNPMFGRKHTIQSKKKMSESHLGDKNPMKQRMWIRNPQTREFKVWLKTVPIPNGWERGRKI